MPGPAELDVRALLLGYAGRVRAIVTVACLLLGLFVVPAADRPAAVAGLLVLLVWTVVSGHRLRRLAGADIMLLCLAAVTQQWTVPAQASADSTGWVLAVLTVAAVTLQWCTPVWTGAFAVAAFVASYLAGAWWAVGDRETQRLTMLLWLIPQAVLSRGAAMWLIAVARRSDRLTAAQESRRSVAAIAAARRADEHAQQALLHDTVAATLLMVGTGAAGGRSAWLRDQAGRDLLVLRQASPAVPTELDELLREEIRRSPLRVEHGPLPSAELPPPVAEALAGAVREALTNVDRHAGVDRAELSATLGPLRVRIADAGSGFRPDQVPSFRRGVAGSIVSRAAAAGGRARINSAPGRGTTVTLEFPDV